MDDPISEFEVVEDESGKYFYPRFMIVNTKGEEVAVFDTEAEAVQGLADMLNALDSMA